MHEPSTFKRIFQLIRNIIGKVWHYGLGNRIEIISIRVTRARKYAYSVKMTLRRKVRPAGKERSTPQKEVVKGAIRKRGVYMREIGAFLETE